MRLRPDIVVASGQGLAALLLLAAWPPATGRMMVTSLVGNDRNAVALLALAGGARLIGSGPLPGSLVVVGDRAALLRRAGWSVLVSAAPPAGCGGAAATSASDARRA